MNIAVFADVHGRISLALKLCARWHSADSHTLTVIEAPWFREYSTHSWRYL